MAQTVLVTGGAGYVGSHACKALARAGYRPVVYDDLSNGHEWAVKWGPLETGSLLDGDRLADVIKRHKPAATLHFAAKAIVGESVAEPALYYRNNVGGTLCLLEAMRSHGALPIVFSSTCAVYGLATETPIRETHSQQPTSPYGASKHMVERILRDADTAYGIRSVSLRYFNAAGADREAEIGEVHDPEPHLIPRLLDVALERDSAITIYGEDYDTPDGTCIRDYIHVEDLADAHVRALGYLLDDGPTTALNLGTGEGASVREVVEAAGLATGRKIQVETGSRRPGDPDRLVADARLAQKTLGWAPSRSDMASVMADAWRWHLKFFGQSKS